MMSKPRPNSIDLSMVRQSRSLDPAAAPGYFFKNTMLDGDRDGLLGTFPFPYDLLPQAARGQASRTNVYLMLFLFVQQAAFVRLASWIPALFTDLALRD